MTCSCHSCIAIRVEAVYLLHYGFYSVQAPPGAERHKLAQCSLHRSSCRHPSQCYAFYSILQKQILPQGCFSRITWKWFKGYLKEIISNRVVETKRYTKHQLGSSVKQSCLKFSGMWRKIIHISIAIIKKEHFPLSFVMVKTIIFSQTNQCLK